MIDPDNSDALLVTSLRNKTSEELLMYPVVTYGTEYIYEAVLIPVHSKPSGVRSHYLCMSSCATLVLGPGH